jgi:hypothetical protein
LLIVSLNIRHNGFIISCQTLQRSRNKVLPHQLVKLRAKDFINIVTEHRTQLEQSWDPKSIDTLERQFSDLLVAYTTEPLLKSEIDKCNRDTPFTLGWRIVAGRFDYLKSFCGGLATVFPNTATVESDFSQIGWEKDEYRMCITDLSLEGVMQCKQFDVLSSL